MADAILGKGKHLSNAELTAAKTYPEDPTRATPAHPAAALLQDPGFKPKPGADPECPLWFYLLAESRIIEKGQRLGAVGGTIVAETLAEIMVADKDSFFQVVNWQPMQTPFKMQDFLKFAGVIPRRRLGPVRITLREGDGWCGRPRRSLRIGQITKFVGDQDAGSRLSGGCHALTGDRVTTPV